MNHIFKTGFLFFLIFFLGLLLATVSIKKTVERNCLEIDCLEVELEVEEVAKCTS